MQCGLQPMTGDERRSGNARMARAATHPPKRQRAHCKAEAREQCTTMMSGEVRDSRACPGRAATVRMRSTTAAKRHPTRQSLVQHLTVNEASKCLKIERHVASLAQRDRHQQPSLGNNARLAKKKDEDGRLNRLVKSTIKHNAGRPAERVRGRGAKLQPAAVRHSETVLIAEETRSEPNIGQHTHDTAKAAA